MIAYVALTILTNTYLSSNEKCFIKIVGRKKGYNHSINL